MQNDTRTQSRAGIKSHVRMQAAISADHAIRADVAVRPHADARRDRSAIIDYDEWTDGHVFSNLRSLGNHGRSMNFGGRWSGRQKPCGSFGEGQLRGSDAQHGFAREFERYWSDYAARVRSLRALPEFFVLDVDKVVDRCGFWICDRRNSRCRIALKRGLQILREFSPCSGHFCLH